MTVQFVEVAGKRMAMLPAEEYERLLEEVEERHEVAEAQTAARARADGMEYLPSDMVNRIVDGESALRVWRQFRGFSATDLGKAVGVVGSHITHLENGTRGGKPLLWRALASALSVDIDDILPVD
ncbi:MAG: helix-turn-helix transcriptional regulator [Chakrabartia godavariana]